MQIYRFCWFTVTYTLHTLSEQLLLLQPPKLLTLKKSRSFFFVLDSACYLSYYRSEADSVKGRPLAKMCLKGCELVADVSVWARKFGINLRVPSADGMAEVRLRCGDEASYARWLSGCKLASRGGSVSAQAVRNEVGSILGLLRAQLHGAGHGGDVAEGGQASDLVTLRMLKKYGVKAVRDFVE